MPQFNKKREDIILERINTALKEMGEYNNYYIVVKTSQVGKALKQQKNVCIQTSNLF